jgi:hypothetical protein
MTSSQTTLSSISACRSVHLEDLRAGEYVTVLQRSYQVGTFAWCGLDTHQYPPETPLDIACRDEFSLLLIKDICLPFVLCTDLDKQVHALDTRSTKFARVPQSFVDSFRKAVKSEKRKALNRDKKKKSKRKSKSKKRK